MFTKSARRMGAYAKELDELYGKSVYISHADLARVNKEYSSLLLNGVGVLLEILCLFFTLRFNIIALIYRQQKSVSYLSLESTRIDHNLDVIRIAQDKGMSIEGKKLDRQQVEAVVACEDANLVMAAAGSGKSLSLLAKCEYLYKSLGVPAHKILVFSFTKKSAAELQDRLDELGMSNIKARTFHSFGRGIIDGGASLKVVTETQQTKIVSEIIDSLMRSDKHFAKRYNDFLLFYYSAPTDTGEIKQLQDLIAYNQSFLQQSLQGVDLNKGHYDTSTPTFAKEYVRSKEEQIIANFLYINNVPYRYEQQYPHVETKYTPDFTIHQFSEPIYLEHQGVHRDGSTRPDISRAAYHKKMTWGIEQHVRYGTVLIQSYSYEWKEGTLLTNLERNLKAAGVEMIRSEEEEIAKLIKDAYQIDTSGMIALIITFLNLFKNGSETLDTLRGKSQNMDKYAQHRASLFFDLFEEILDRYNQYMTSESKLDFSDMIKRATCQIPSIPREYLNFDYMLVDEVQDLSRSRFDLLKALLDHAPNSKIFCVGDDWQAIYRFAGSDLTLIQDFEDLFERKTYYSMIEQTHRFGNPVLDVSSRFIQENTSQVVKNIYTSQKASTEIIVNYGGTQRDDIKAACEELERLSLLYGEKIQDMTIYLLGRYKADINRLIIEKSTRLSPQMLLFEAANDTSVSSPFFLLDKQNDILEWTSASGDRKIKLHFTTMHRAKGMTCDVAIILNANGGAYGIPAARSEDPILALLLTHPDAFPFAEERRLFYVSLTRAKHQTVIISTSDNPSSFVDEVHPREREFASKCPKCHSGTLGRKSGKYGDFMSCSNFRYGCDYIDKIYTPHATLSAEV